MSLDHGHGLELTEGDLQFAARQADAGGLGPERLLGLMRTDPAFRDAVVADPQMLERIAAAGDEELLRVSPRLYFHALLRQALLDLGRRSHTLERAGSSTVVVFDAGEVGDFLAKPAVLPYLSAMLASFTRVESYVMPVRVRRGTWRRVRFNDMDVDSLMALAETVEEGQRFRYYKRIADVCLFIVGVFPASAPEGAPGAARRTAGGGRGRRTGEEYAQVGRRFYRTAGEAPAAGDDGVAEAMALLRDNFATARKALNFVGEQYLRYARSRVFDVGAP